MPTSSLLFRSPCDNIREQECVIYFPKTILFDIDIGATSHTELSYGTSFLNIVKGKATRSIANRMRGKERKSVQVFGLYCKIGML